jgi:hypothetical protein
MLNNGAAGNRNRRTLLTHVDCGLSLEFVREPEWTLHFCAVARPDVISCDSLFTARPVRARRKWLTGLAADWTVASPPFEKGRSRAATAVHPAHRTRRQPRDVCTTAADRSSKSLRIESTDRDIAHRAYDLYEKHGREPEHDIDDWPQAERELQDALSSTAA